jgi:hypothetical protein
MAENNDIDALVDRYGEETMAKAFYVQEQIYTEGLSSVNFTDAAENEMEQRSRILIWKAINDQFPKDI